MEPHIAILIGGEPLALPDDFGLDIEWCNPYFSEAGDYSYPVALPTAPNAALLRDIRNPQSATRQRDIERTADGKDVLADIIVDGVPMQRLRLRIDDDAEVTDTIGISFESEVKALKTLVSDLNCNDIPVIDRIPLGMKLCELEATFNGDFEVEFAKVIFNGRGVLFCHAETATELFDVPALGFSTPVVSADSQGNITERAINVSLPYPAKPYCNVRMCYVHKTKDGDEVSSGDVYDPYYMLDADREASAPCMYVLYFLKCLFAKLEMIYDESALTAVEDMKHLAFMNTDMQYDYDESAAGAVVLPSLTSINNWLRSIQYGKYVTGELAFRKEWDGKKGTKPSVPFKSVKLDDPFSLAAGSYRDSLEEGSEMRAYFEGLTLRVGETYNPPSPMIAFSPTELLVSPYYNVSEPTMSVSGKGRMMLANGKNFPAQSVSTVLDSLWASFGIRFLIDYERRMVKPVFIRDLYRDTRDPLELLCEVLDVVPVTERIEGFHAGYDAESSLKEQQRIVTEGVKDFDDDYDYTDYSRVDDTLTYQDIVRRDGSTDRTCYIDRTTGNAYRIKVNKDAKTLAELAPALFEVAEYNGVRVGNTDDDDTTETMASAFRPVGFNDLYGRIAKEGGIASGAGQQLLAAFADVDMKHENTPMTLAYPVDARYAKGYVDAEFATDEAYDVESAENGESPLQGIDWGLGLFVMRGGGSDGSLEDYDPDYDGFGNNKWTATAGQYAASTDSIDAYGNAYDYNGTQEGTGGGERFSLKMRAYKTVNGEQAIDNPSVAGRGLFDTFLAEHAHFVLNRKLLRVTVRCEMAELLRVKDNWGRRFRIGETVGWVRKVKVNPTVQNGLGEATLEIYSL